jgi:hypothetical protein
MKSSIILLGALVFSSPNLDFPVIWKKIEGKWSYVGEVKEKTQILFWLERDSKSPNKSLHTKEIKKMPFITLSPKGEVVEIEPLQ